MDAWDLALVVVAGFAAVAGLARLMNWRRSQLVEELVEEIEQKKQRRPSASVAEQSPSRPIKTA
jgi:hypothetical protein